ncbi:hypothetical protein OUZ56_003120 [Daphnia magna]|uniref:Uncharacterized protein n=1 Tax=Daphnia magna TaxID=35525 RepID=A0ABR0A7T7_9CRUS|nr:hypothetical protein OUZ56_003120 [Daphnia magna]
MPMKNSTQSYSVAHHFKAFKLKLKVTFRYLCIWWLGTPGAQVQMRHIQQSTGGREKKGREGNHKADLAMSCRFLIQLNQISHIFGETSSSSLKRENRFGAFNRRS